MESTAQIISRPFSYSGWRSFCFHSFVDADESGRKWKLFLLWHLVTQCRLRRHRYWLCTHCQKRRRFHFVHCSAYFGLFSASTTILLHRDHSALGDLCNTSVSLVKSLGGERGAEGHSWNWVGRWIVCENTSEGWSQNKRLLHMFLFGESLERLP